MLVTADNARNQLLLQGKNPCLPPARFKKGTRTTGYGGLKEPPFGALTARGGCGKPKAGGNTARHTTPDEAVRNPAMRERLE